MNRRMLPLTAFFAAVASWSCVAFADESEAEGGGGESVELNGADFTDRIIFTESMQSHAFDGDVFLTTTERNTPRHADVDNDGDADLVIGADLYIANGEGSFALFSRAAELGATLDPVDDVLRSQLKLPDDQGLVVTKIVPNMRLAKVGLQDDDILLQVDEQSISDAAQLKKALSNGQGKRATITFVRHGKKQTATLENPWEVITFELPKEYRIGVSVSPTDRTVQSQLQLPKGEGLIVTEVIAETPAAKIGIKQHDVLLRVDDKVLKTFEDLRGSVRASEGRTLSIHIVRGGNKVTKKVKPELVKQSPQHVQLMIAGADRWNTARFWDVENGAVIKEFDLAPGAAIASAPEAKPQSDVGDKLDQVLKQLEQLRNDVKNLRQRLPVDKSKK